MKCPRCNGRKYIELDKIGILVSDCPLCHGTGEGFDMTGKKPIVESASTEGYVTTDEIPAGLANATTYSSNDTLTIPAELEEMVKDNATELFNDFNEVLNGNINGDNRDTGSGDTSQSTSTEKPKVKRRTRKKAR